MITQISASGLLDSEALDSLADTFVFASENLSIEVPSSWFGGLVVEIDLTDLGGAPADKHARGERAADEPGTDEAGTDEPGTDEPGTDDVAAAQLLARALGWPHRSVRLAALSRLADRGDLETAYGRASSDPDAGIRQWAETVRAERDAASGDQASLF